MTEINGNAVSKKLIAVVMTRAEAKAFVDQYHRHHGAPAGSVLTIGVSDGENLVGVAIAGRPVNRHLDDGLTMEVTRCCVVPSAPKGSCSFLYSRLWVAAKALGWHRMITYTLQSESGSSLRGAGWKVVAEVKPDPTKKWTNRMGREWNDVTSHPKFRWEVR